MARILLLRNQPDPCQPSRLLRHLRHRLQLAAFSTLYGPAARVYDRFTAWLFHGEWARWQDVAAAHLPTQGTIVELGSGTGALAARAARPDQHWICIEPSPQMLRAAAHRRGPNHGLIQADARALPLARGSASAVIATFPTSFILDPACHEEIARILSSDGPLIVLFSARLAGASWAVRWRRLLLSAFYGSDLNDDALSDFLTCFTGFNAHIEEIHTQSGAAFLLLAIPHQGDGQTPPPSPSQ